MRQLKERERENKRLKIHAPHKRESSRKGWGGPRLNSVRIIRVAKIPRNESFSQQLQWVPLWL